MVALLVGQILEQTVRPYTWFPWLIVIWVVLMAAGAQWLAAPTARAARAGRRRARHRRDRSRPRVDRGPVLMGCVIGVDVGSQSVKAVVADDQGRRSPRRARPARCTTPPAAGRSRTPATGRRRSIAAVRQARTERRPRARRHHDARASPARSTGWSRSTRGCGRCGPRSSGSTAARPTSPRRSRTRSASRSWWRRTGLNPDASHVAPKAMWLRDVEPGQLRRDALAGLGRART